MEKFICEISMLEGTITLELIMNSYSELVAGEFAATVEIKDALVLVLMLSFDNGYLTVVAIVTLEVLGVISGLGT